MTKRARIEPIDASQSATMWLFTTTSSLSDWRKKGCHEDELGINEDAFCVTIKPNECVYVEMVGYEYEYHGEKFDRYNCVTVVKCDNMPGVGSKIKVYLGWADKSLLKLKTSTNKHFKVKMLKPSDKISFNDEYFDDEALVNAFSGALKNVEQILHGAGGD